MPLRGLELEREAHPRVVGRRRANSGRQDARHEPELVALLEWIVSREASMTGGRRVAWLTTSEPQFWFAVDDADGHGSDRVRSDSVELELLLNAQSL